MRLNPSEKVFAAIIITTLISMSFSNNLSFGDTDSPRKQLQKGTMPEDVICKPGSVLVILTSDKPACLKQSTVSKLDERGHIKSIVKEFVQSTISPEIKKEETSSTQNSSSTDSSSIQGNTGKPYIPPKIENIPASAGSIVNFYITDDDLNISRNGVDVIPTRGLLEFTINGITINGPETMIETGPNTGQFYVKLQLPDTIEGRPLSQDDIVQVKYLDQSDAAGDTRASVKSIPLGKTYAQIQTSNSGRTLIGHEFTVRIYEPDANLDSKDVNRIPLSSIEYRGEGGIRTTLANPVFDANGSFLRETGENTGIFEVIIKIPRTIDGKTVNIGDWYEIRYTDKSTPSNTNEEIKLKGKIG